MAERVRKSGRENMTHEVSRTKCDGSGARERHLHTAPIALGLSHCMSWRSGYTIAHGPRLTALCLLSQSVQWASLQSVCMRKNGGVMSRHTGLVLESQARTYVRTRIHVAADKDCRRGPRSVPP